MTKVAALLMAAGNSRRMGGPNKLLMPFSKRPLISFAVDAVRNANFAMRKMVTGRDHIELKHHGSDFEIIHNPKFESGFGSSLAAGFSAINANPDIGGALVMLADLPLITASHLNKMIDVFSVSGERAIIRAAHDIQPGNPVIIPQALFAAMAKLDGEQSGQAIVKASGLEIILVDIGPAALTDIDTPEALAALQEAVL